MEMGISFSKRTICQNVTMGSNDAIEQRKSTRHENLHFSVNTDCTDNALLTSARARLLFPCDAAKNSRTQNAADDLLWSMDVHLTSSSRTNYRQICITTTRQDVFRIWSQWRYRLTTNLRSSDAV